MATDEPATDYFLLAVADPTNVVSESDSDPLNKRPTLGDTRFANS